MSSKACWGTGRMSPLAALVVLGLASFATAQETPAPIGIGRDARAVIVPPAVLEIGIEDAVRLATTDGTELRAAYYEHLIERTRVEEAVGAFDPVLFADVSGGRREVVFPEIFPTGNLLPDGTPEFFQTIVNDATEVASLSAGVRGLLATGATWELRFDSDYRDRERGGLVNPSFSTSTQLIVTQPILRSAWEQYGLGELRQARFGEGRARQRYRSEVLRTVFEVQQAYWDHVFARRDLVVKRASLDLAERLLEINRIKVERGVFAPIEIAAAESGVASRVTDVLVGENEVADTADVLRRMILPFVDEDDWNIPIVPTDDIDARELTVPDLDTCMEIAMNERPDLLEAKLDLQSRALTIALADTESLPKLDLVGSIGYTGLDRRGGSSFTGAFGEGGAETWSVGLEFELPIGNRSARARLTRAWLERDQALVAFHDLRIDAMEEVRRAYRRLDLARRTIESRARAEELKREELRNEQIKLDNKVSTNFQVLEVQEDLSLRASEALRAQADYRIALAELARALGSTPEALGWRVVE